MRNYKNESTIILICIITIITFYCICWIFKMLNKIELELFSSNNSKRDKMKKIYKSDDISDPDEILTDDANDNVMDPDDDYAMDPDDNIHMEPNYDNRNRLNPNNNNRMKLKNDLIMMDPYTYRV
jgi:hypothetical protein